MQQIFRTLKSLKGARPATQPAKAPTVLDPRLLKLVAGGVVVGSPDIEEPPSPKGGW